MQKDIDNFKYINKGLQKLDGKALVNGMPVYTGDLAPKECLIIKLLRSPHAHALIESIDTSKAKMVAGIEAVYTYEDVPDLRYTNAGQTYPEPSPYDRKILDQRVRFIGDPVAIVVGADEQCVSRALKMIKVKYQVLPAVLDPHTAKDNEILVHPEENWKALCAVGADNKRNLVAQDEIGEGDIEAVLADCDYVQTGTYTVHQANQAYMEPFSTYCFLDAYGRLNIVSSTQIVYHVRRIVSNALGIPKSKIRVTKPRIGGGFGAKQSSVSEVYPAFVTWKTGKPSKIVYTRRECMIAGSPRHEMEVTVRVGAMKDGTIRAMDMYTLSNTGAYSEHGPTTVGLSGHKSIPLYGRNCEAFHFKSEVVYTNTMSNGAYRGYGATQGLFAMESAVSELADRLGMDPVAIREKNLLLEGERMPAYYGEPNDSCALDLCVKKAKEMMKWDETPRVRDLGNGKVITRGVALAMQGSCISNLDVGSATIKIGDDGLYTLMISAADMGTGCDTILSQIAAEVLQVPYDQIMVLSADTDATPYDAGSYASSTTFVTGRAVFEAASKMIENLTINAAAFLGITDADQIEGLCFEGDKITDPKTGASISVADIATKAMAMPHHTLEVTCSHCSETSPPPYMCGMVELMVDTETGETELMDYAAVVDCGTPINRNLARVQVEGGLGQGIGMTLTEDVCMGPEGRLYGNSFMQYKIPSRMELHSLRVDFESSYEDRGPFGAKSIGEIVINTPAPAINNALAQVTGEYFHELPITPEKILMAIRRNRK